MGKFVVMGEKNLKLESRAGARKDGKIHVLLIHIITIHLISSIRSRPRQKEKKTLFLHGL
jgi:hypothetical protein